MNILVEDKKTGKSKKFSNSGGLSSYVKFLKGRKQNISEIFHCEGEQDGLSVEIALQWNDAYSENVLCYTNNIPQKRRRNTPFRISIKFNKSDENIYQKGRN